VEIDLFFEKLLIILECGTMNTFLLIGFSALILEL